MNIKSASVISTKNGDLGMSKNYSNESFQKTDIVFDTLGTIDEFSATLGLAYQYTHEPIILTIQRTLQDINTLIATNPESERYKQITQITEKDIEVLEAKQQALLDFKPIEPRFVLPGSEASLGGAYFDLARTVCRRAERQLIRFIDSKKREDLTHPRSYMNRLSDLLFIFARNHQS